MFLNVRRRLVLQYYRYKPRLVRIKWKTIAKGVGVVILLKLLLTVILGFDSPEPLHSDMVIRTENDELAANASARAAMENVTTTTTTTTTMAPTWAPPVEGAACSNLEEYQSRALEASNDSWRPVQEGVSFAFAAHLDNRNEDKTGRVLIRTIMMVDGWVESTVPYCQLWFDHGVVPFALKSNQSLYFRQESKR